MPDVMHDFTLYQPATLDEALSLLARHPGAWVLAGGNDSLEWFKHRVKTPPVVIDISELDGLDGISEGADGGLMIGALTTLAGIEADARVAARFPALAAAAGQVASPQIRNVSTIGGNVAQDTRCSYYREGFACYRAGGRACYAATATAMNREHALFDASLCVAVTPSDTAPVLSALGARFHIAGPDGERVLSAGQFFIGPDINVMAMTALREDEILTAIELPGRWAGAAQVFEKVAERGAWDFALVNIALAARMEGATITAASVVCGGVACTPYRLAEVESLLAGAAADETTEMLARRLAARGAQPLGHNRFKIPLMENLVARAIRGLRA